MFCFYSTYIFCYLSKSLTKLNLELIFGFRFVRLSNVCMYITLMYVISVIYYTTNIELDK